MQASPRARRAAAITALTAVTVLGLATGASAHVTANPSTAEQGSYAKVSFRVPNERDNADTTKIQIDMPNEPLAHVSVRPAPGWTVKVETADLAQPVQTEGGELTEAVSRITWTGGKIKPGQFEEFDVSMGPLPTGVDRVLFKAAQTYSGGEVVNWDQDPGNGQNEPEHPAPSLTLTPKGAPTAPANNLVAARTPAVDGSDATARLVGVLGVAAGVIGIGIGGLGLARGRKQS